MKRSPIRKIRKTLRRNEPSPAEKKRARELCYERAKGRCEMPFPHPCPGIVYLESEYANLRGQLAHFRNKRTYGWMESEETGQRHLWSCPMGHYLSHVRGWSGEKIVPSKKGLIPPEI